MINLINNIITEELEKEGIKASENPQKALQNIHREADTTQRLRIWGNVLRRVYVEAFNEGRKVGRKEVELTAAYTRRTPVDPEVKEAQIAIRYGIGSKPLSELQKQDLEDFKKAEKEFRESMAHGMHNIEKQMLDDANRVGQGYEERMMQATEDHMVGALFGGFNFTYPSEVSQSPQEETAEEKEAKANEILKQKHSNAGKKIKGFKFDTPANGVPNWVPEMQEHVGEVGVIVDYRQVGNYYNIQFRNDSWSYPADEVEAQLAKRREPYGR